VKLEALETQRVCVFAQVSAGKLPCILVVIEVVGTSDYMKLVKTRTTYL